MNQTRTTTSQDFPGTSRILDGRRSVSSTSWIDNIRGPRPQTSQRLEELIDVDRNVEVFSNEQLNMFNPRRIYGQNLFSYSTALYRHHRSEALHLPDGREERLSLITDESAR